MVNPSTSIPNGLRWCAVVALAFVLTGCNKHAAEIALLKEDNERLRVEIANLRRNGLGGTEPEVNSGKPDLILGMTELWKQRFEDNEFRAKQRLAGKTLRVTGVLDEISTESVSIYGVGKARNMRMVVIFDRGFATQAAEGMGALERGVTVTVQGKFAYDRMELNGAKIVDKTSGEPMTAGQLKQFGLVGPDGVPAPPSLPENQ